MSDIHRALRAAVEGSSTTQLVRFLSLQIRLYLDEKPVANFRDAKDREWVLVAHSPVGDGWACTYERV